MLDDKRVKFLIYNNQIGKLFNRAFVYLYSGYLQPNVFTAVQFSCLCIFLTKIC